MRTTVARHTGLPEGATGALPPVAHAWSLPWCCWCLSSQPSHMLWEPQAGSMEDSSAFISRVLQHLTLKFSMSPLRRGTIYTTESLPRAEPCSPLPLAPWLRSKHVLFQLKVDSFPEDSRGPHADRLSLDSPF